MQPTKSTSISNQDSLNKSITKALAGNLSPGTGVTYDIDGQPLTFNIDNMSGVIIRVGSSANPFALPYFWAASNVDLTIEHNLGKVPYGYIVIAKSGPCDVYWGSIAATTTHITLRNTDATQGTTIWIMC